MGDSAGVIPRRSLFTPSSGVRLLGVVRWVMPLVLAAIALLVEVGEHVREGETDIDPAFVLELLLFALIGPIVVALTLGWVMRLLTAYQATSDELEVANRDLELRIAERTAHLAAAGEQLRRANAELARANEELRQIDALKSEFVSLVSHQLRAPLTNLNGALELVAQDAEGLPAGSRRTLQILTQEAQRLSRLIQTILEVSRVEAGRLVPRLGPVAVEPLLVRICTSTLAAEPDRPWSVRSAGSVPPAWADETLLEEVVRNLVENAMHYSPVGSPIEVTVDIADTMLEVAVTDHGAGIPAAEQSRIFESFHRVGDDESTVKGYGLGLYFADRLIRALGGTIDVSSPAWSDRDAPGSRFVFSIPVAGAEPDDAEPHDEAERPTGPALGAAR
jgi:signal transduction histidine kinase